MVVSDDFLNDGWPQDRLKGWSKLAWRWLRTGGSFFPSNNYLLLFVIARSLRAWRAFFPADNNFLFPDDWLWWWWWWWLGARASFFSSNNNFFFLKIPHWRWRDWLSNDPFLAFLSHEIPSTIGSTS